MTFNEFLENFSTAFSQGSWLSLIIALGAGIVSSGICPCTLPIGLGMAGLVSSQSKEGSGRGYRIAIAFFTGILFCMATLGTLAGGLGMLLSESFSKFWALSMTFISAIAAGMAFYGPRLKVTQLESLRRPGLVGSFIYGLIYSLGTSAAPLLLLLSIAAATASLPYGFLLAIAFGVGRGLPFLIVGLFAGAVSKWARLNWLRTGLQILSGSALLFVSIYYLKVFINLI